MQEALKDGARQVGAGVRHRRIRQAFVVAEIALAVVLLVGAGLMIRSFGTLRGVNPGFDARNVLTARVTVPTRRYPDEAKRIDFFANPASRASRRSRASRARARSATCRWPAPALGPASRSSASRLRCRVRGRPPTSASATTDISAR